MKNLTLIFFIFYFFSSVQISWAEESLIENFNLKAGLNYSKVNLQSSLLPNSPKRDDEDETHGGGFSTSFGYRFNRIDLHVQSDVIFGNLNDLTFKVENDEIRGSGHYRIFTFSPLFRYYTEVLFYKRWNLYFDLGPSFSQHTFIITNVLGGTSFSDKKRISFENMGINLSLGFEEFLSYKQMHPAYIEIGYSFMRSRKITIVDASDFTDVKTISNGDSNDFSGHYLTVRIGITLF